VVGGANVNDCPASNSQLVLTSTQLTIQNQFSPNNINVRATIDPNPGGVIGNFQVRQADQVAATTIASNNGVMIVRAGNNNNSYSAAGAFAVAGSLGTFAGAALTANSFTHNGFRQDGAPFRRGTTVTPWYLECQSGVEETVQDCGAIPTYVLGVAQVSTTPNANSVLVITSGEVPISCSGGCVIGHTVCAGAAAGQVTDSGGTGPCSTGFLVGVVNRIAGTYRFPDNNLSSAASISFDQALSANLPAIVLLGRK
jgi:hypothetical protein